jgi:S1-C subfamily serine protease
MSESISQKITATLAIIATPFALGAFILAWSPAEQFQDSNPKHDGYVQPRSIGALVERTQESTVTVFCTAKDNSFSLGTAWSIKIKNSMGAKYPTTLITNHHVIDDCLAPGSKLTIAELYEKEVPAVITKWDEENDLAVLATKTKIRPLELSQAEPWPGYWVMALGSADGYEGSVAFGNVLNGTKNEIFTTVPISHGNSGGPLIDNEGNVVGVNSWSSTTEQYNGAMSLNAMCKVIMKCDDELYWARDN